MSRCVDFSAHSNRPWECRHCGAGRAMHSVDGVVGEPLERVTVFGTGRLLAKVRRRAGGEVVRHAASGEPVLVVAVPRSAGVSSVQIVDDWTVSLSLPGVGFRRGSLEDFLGMVVPERAP